MKALVYLGPEKMELQERDIPVPGEGEVLVRVKIAGICGSDVHGYTGSTGRRIPPMVMGHEFSGEVAGLGSGVKGFAEGDRITVFPAIACGSCEACKSGKHSACKTPKSFGVMKTDGAMTEYVVARADALVRIPDNVSFEVASMAEPLAVGYHALGKIPDPAGQNVLVVGSGTIGLVLAALLATKGCKNIIVSDLANSRLEVAKQLGATAVINPKEQDFMEEIGKITNGNMIDIGFEAVGNGVTVSQTMDALKGGGTAVWVGNSAKIIEVDMQNIVTRQLTVFGTYGYTREGFEAALALLGNGKVNLDAVISKVVPLADGAEYFHKLAHAPGDLIKVLLSC